MATFIVTNLNDSGAGSLRDAVNQANSNLAADTITFDASLAGQTITLTSGQIDITTSTTEQALTIDGDIDGDNKADVTISGNNASRIFSISGNGGDTTLESLTLTNGKAQAAIGGAVDFSVSSGSLTISDSTLSNNTAAIGGALHVGNTGVTISNSLFTGNSADGDGGAINVGGLTSVAIINSTMQGNSAGGFGGAVNVASLGSATFTNSTVTGNLADSDGSSGTAGGGISGQGLVGITSWNSVFAGNLSGTGATANDVQSSTGIFNNSVFGTNVSGVTTGTNGNVESVADVGLGALQDNGGTVLTRAILADSVLINQGSNSAPSLPSTDANGNARIVAGTADVGATEFQLVVTTASDVVDANDGLLSLREALTLANANADADTITFDASLKGQTITLGGTQLAITTDVTIDGDTDGDNKADITLNGNASSRIFSVSGSGTDANLNSLTLTNGKSLGYSGGAVSSTAGTTLSISDSTIAGNFATWGGGIGSYGTLTVANSTISGNMVSGEGGGVFLNSGATASFTNTTIDGNTAGASGGGIMAGSSTVSLGNSTVTANTSYNSGGGIAAGQSTVNITNSVIALNSASFGNGTISDPNGNSTVIASNSFFGSTVTIAGGSGNQNGGGDPLLGALQDNGGTVMTRDILFGSALMDSGSNSGAAGITTDANGNARITNGTVDIGATEVRNIVVTTASDVVDANDGVTSLREAVALANADVDYDIISFDASLAGSTITLTGGELALTKDVSIDGEANGITISGNHTSRIFMAGDGTAGVDIAVKNLTLADGNAQGGNGGTPFSIPGKGYGGGGGGLGAGGALFIRDGASVTLTDVALADNAAAGGNGSGGAHAVLGGSGAYAGFGTGGAGGVTQDDPGAGGFGAGGGGVGFEVVPSPKGYTTVIGHGALGGFGGGAGAYLENDGWTGVGGGGAGFGGGIFVHDGGSLTVAGGGNVSGGSVTGGAGYQNGSAAGAGLFLMNETVTFAPDAGKTMLIADSSADDFGNGGSAGGSLVMNGAGTLELSGTSTFTGSTTVDDGLLKVTGSIANSEVSINSGGTLGGGGTTGDVTVNSGGTLSPGSSPGTLHTGDLTLNSGSHFTVEIAGTTAGTDYDQVVVTGTVTLNGASLDLSLLNSFDPVAGDSFTIIDNDGADAVTGSFAGAAEGGFINSGAQTFEVSYQGGDGNDVTLTAVDLKVNTAADETYDGGSFAEELADGGGLSLREAVALANKSANADGITFDASLAGQTLVLTGGELTLSNDVTIDGDTSGDHKADITISGNNASRIFNMQNGSADFRSLTLTNGSSGGYGGAISAYNASTLTISDCTISNSHGKAGGVYAGNLSAVTIANSLLTANTGSVFGGALTTKGVNALNIVNTTIDGNSSVFSGGGVYAMFTNASVVNSTITGNYSNFGGGMYSLVSYTTFINSVVAGNTGGDAYAHFSTTAAANSFFGSTSHIHYNNGGNINGGGDPMLGELLDNGGTVLTRSPLDGSPLIGAGSNAALPLDTFDIDHDGNTTELLPIDSRGGIRLVGGNVDIGAVEQIVDERIGGTDGANHIFGGEGIDKLRGRDGDDTLDGGNGRDNLAGGLGADALDGGASLDVASYATSGQAVTVDLAAGTGSGGQAAGDTLTGIEGVVGSSFGDTLSGDNANNLLKGMSGDDTLSGMERADRLFGGDGADRLDGGAGHDKLSGGADSDTFVLHKIGATADIIADFEAGIDIVEISALEFGSHLAAGALPASTFALDAAVDPDDRFVYDTVTGELWFDNNGSDPGHARLIATLSGAPALTASGILIV